MQIRLALVDDKAINRNTLKNALSASENIQILFEAENGQEFLSKLAVKGEEIDVVLMDLEMPELDGIESIYRARISHPHIKFIVHTVFEDSDKIFSAIKAGAHGYLLKEDRAIDILDAVKSVHEHGAVPMSPIVARKVLQFMGGANKETTIPVAEENPLSKRENEILNHLIAGKNYKKIGDVLFISPFTVRRHVANIYEKLHVKSRAEIINLAHNKKWF